MTAFFIMSPACSRSQTSMFEWCVRVSVLHLVLDELEAGMPTASNDRWSVPLVFCIVSVFIPRLSNGCIHAAKTGAMASLPCR